MEELRLILYVPQQQHSQLSQLSLVITVFQNESVLFFFSFSWANILNHSFKLLTFPCSWTFKISRLQNCPEEEQAMFNPVSTVTKSSFVNKQVSVLLRLLSALPKHCIGFHQQQKQSLMELVWTQPPAYSSSSPFNWYPHIIQKIPKRLSVSAFGN